MSRTSLDVALFKILREKAKGSVCLFDKGDFVSVYDEDALLIARQIFRSEVGVKRIQIGERNMAYITLAGGQYERVVRELLLSLHYRVQLYKVADGQWTLKCQGSPGNMDDFEEIGDLGKEATPLLAIHIPRNRRIHGKVSGVVMDPISLKITHAQLEDDEKLSHLEQFVISSNARECLVVGECSPERLTLVKTILRRANILPTIKVKQAGAKDLLRVLSDEAKEKVSALGEELGWCMCWVAEYLNLKQPGWTSKFSLADYDNGRFMRLDSAAVKAFELFAPANSSAGSGTQGTVFATLNKCKTPTGQRLLKEWLARPLCDIRLLEERYDCIQALIESTEERRSLHSTHLPKLPDLAFLARRLLRKKARLLDCYRIAQAIRSLGRMRDCIWELVRKVPSCSASVKDLMLLPVMWGCEQFKDLVVCVDEVIDDSLLKSGGGLRIKPSIDPTLTEISHRLDEINRNCKKALSKVSTRVANSTIKLDMNSQHGYFFRVTMKEEKSIRGVAGLKVIDATKGSGVRFRDSLLENLNEEYLRVNEEYLSAQKHLEDTTVQICGTYAAALSSLASQLAVVDVVVALSVVASSSTRPHCRPTLKPKGDGTFCIIGCRHAVLDPLIDFIPNDIDLSDTRALIVTGANMGGKSTLLRSAALTSILAQMGAFVPADSATLAIQESVHARVGASDRLSAGISTFMAEMLECAKMIQVSASLSPPLPQSATRDSLVVVDEIGRGTSTFDGFGLAWGITRELIERVGCRLLVATHFTELASMQRPPLVRAIHMKVQPRVGREEKGEQVHTEGDQLAHLYQAEGGVAEASLGIHVATMVGISSGVVAAAREYFDELSEMEKKKEREREAIKSAAPENLREVILSATTF